MEGDRKMTNRQLADALDIHHTMSSRLFTGARSPGFKTMRSISEKFKIPFHDVIDAKEAGTIPALLASLEPLSS